MEAQRDETVMTLLVAESKGFILRCASKVCKRFITDSDDEYEEAVCISENVFGKKFFRPPVFSSDAPQYRMKEQNHRKNRESFFRLSGIFQVPMGNGQCQRAKPGDEKREE